MVFLKRFSQCPLLIHIAFFPWDILIRPIISIVSAFFSGFFIVFIFENVQLNVNNVRVLDERKSEWRGERGFKVDQLPIGSGRQWR